MSDQTGVHAQTGFESLGELVEVPAIGLVKLATVCADQLSACVSKIHTVRIVQIGTIAIFTHIDLLVSTIHCAATARAGQHMTQDDPRRAHPHRYAQFTISQVVHVIFPFESVNHLQAGCQTAANLQFVEIADQSSQRSLSPRSVKQQKTDDLSGSSLKQQLGAMKKSRIVQEKKVSQAETHLIEIESDASAHFFLRIDIKSDYQPVRCTRLPHARCPREVLPTRGATRTGKNREKSGKAISAK